ncbi:hypothetical protein BJ741DRAFT_610345 [Chytriomyces cf. hyalinus JEL632]|nr:hypothetical protein BJ741DRAFT_610345 [Chytriomyces cf. hyalinus JEL632]
MQGPTPNATTPELTTPEETRGSADGGSTSEPKTNTSKLEATVLTETISTTPLTALDQDQVPDDKAETKESTPDHVTPVLDSVETLAGSEPVLTPYGSTQNDPLDELVTGVESLQVERTDDLQLRFKVVLTRDLDPSIPVANRALSPRRSNHLSAIPAPYTVIMTRNGFSLAYTNIHKPEAYIERVLMNEAEF